MITPSVCVGEESSSDESIRTGKRRRGALVTMSRSLRRLVDRVPPRFASFRSSDCQPGRTCLRPDDTE